MPRSKVFPSADEAVARITEGSVIMVAGFVKAGTPENLVRALIKAGVGGLTCICGPWYSRDLDLYDAARLVANGQVKKVITTAPIYTPTLGPALGLWREAQLEVEVTTAGTLVERIRAGGAGLGGIFLPETTGTASPASNDGKETHVIGGQELILEMPLKADFALLRAYKADSLGNLIYRRAQRNWNPIMAMAAEVTIVEVEEITRPDELDPELVITPAIYVDRIVAIGGNLHERTD